MSHVIYSGTPSLPYSFDYTPHVDEPVLLSFSGTAWTGKANAKIGLELVINGTVVTSANIFSNSPSQHRALHAGITSYTFPVVVNPSDGTINPVSITIRAIGGTNFDSNDYVTVAHI